MPTEAEMGNNERIMTLVSIVHGFIQNSFSDMTDRKPVVTLLGVCTNLICAGYMSNRSRFEEVLRDAAEVLDHTEMPKKG